MSGVPPREDGRRALSERPAEWPAWAWPGLPQETVWPPEGHEEWQLTVRHGRPRSRGPALLLVPSPE